MLKKEHVLWWKIYNWYKIYNEISHKKYYVAKATRTSNGKLPQRDEVKPTGVHSGRVKCRIRIYGWAEGLNIRKKIADHSKRDFCLSRGTAYTIEDFQSCLYSEHDKLFFTFFTFWRTRCLICYGIILVHFPALYSSWCFFQRKGKKISNSCY